MIPNQYCKYLHTLVMYINQFANVNFPFNFVHEHKCTSIQTILLINFPFSFVHKPTYVHTTLIYINFPFIQLRTSNSMYANVHEMYILFYSVTKIFLHLSCTFKLCYYNLLFLYRTNLGFH